MQDLITKQLHVIQTEKDGLISYYSDNKHKIILPSSMNLKIIQAVHELFMHAGREKLYDYVN